MWRLALVLIVGGGVLGFYGFNEFRLGSGASAEPEPITMAEPEKGIPDNPHRTVGEHVVDYQSAVWSEETKKGAATGKVNFVYYGAVQKGTPELL